MLPPLLMENPVLLRSGAATGVVAYAATGKVCVTQLALQPTLALTPL